MKYPALKRLILPVITIASIAAIACSGGDGSDEIVSNAPIDTSADVAAQAAQPDDGSTTTFASTDMTAPEIVK